MERKDGAKNEETMRIRMSTDLLERIRAAKVPCGWGEEADSSFTRHLIIVGLGEEEQIVKKKEIRNKVELEQAAIEVKPELEKQDKDWKEETHRLIKLMCSYKNDLMWGGSLDGPYDHLEGKIAYDTLCAAIRAEGVNPENLLNGTLFVEKAEKRGA